MVIIDIRILIYLHLFMHEKKPSSTLMEEMCEDSVVCDFLKEMLFTSP